MAQTIRSNSPSNTTTSGADLGFLTDQNIMTLTGIAVGAVTVGGAAFVAAAVVPGHVVGGTLATATLLTGGHFKKTTGSCFPFLGDKKDKDTPTPLTAVPAA